MQARSSVDPTVVRTVALVGHRSSGKTTLAEHLLAAARVVRAPGRVDEGRALMDHLPRERRGGGSRRLATAWLDWEDHRIHVLDVPGSLGRVADRRNALNACDLAILVVDATRGVCAGTLRAIADCQALQRPLMVVLSRIDQSHDPEWVLGQLSEVLTAPVLPLHLPFWDDEGRLAGVLSPVSERALRYDPDGSGAFSPEPMRTSDARIAAMARERIAETVAGIDDDLLEAYLEYFELDTAQLHRGIAEGLQARTLHPVLLASPARGIGASGLLNAIVRWGPAPEAVTRWAKDASERPLLLGPSQPFAAQIVSNHRDEHDRSYALLRVLSGATPRKGRWTHVRTERDVAVGKVYRVRGPRRAVARDCSMGEIIGVWGLEDARVGDVFTHKQRWTLGAPELPPPQAGRWVGPATEGSVESTRRFAHACAQRVVEDPALQVSPSEEGGWVFHGLSEEHLDHTVEALQDEWGGAVRTRLPHVNYFETPIRAVSGIQGTHSRLDGAGLTEAFGQCTLEVEPLGAVRDILVEDCIPAEMQEDLPAPFRPPVGEGIRSGASRGPMAGYPVVGFRARLIGGEYDCMVSEADHFAEAGRSAIEAAIERSGTRLLEPWCQVAVTCPSEAVGEVLNDISSHRGRVLELDAGSRGASVSALCPERELRTFGRRLQALTRGMGEYTASFSHLETLPEHLVAEAISAGPSRCVSHAEDPQYRAC